MPIWYKFVDVMDLIYRVIAIPLDWFFKGLYSVIAKAFKLIYRERWF